VNEYQEQFFRLLNSALSALKMIPVKMRNDEQKYCIERIEKILQEYLRTEV